MFFSISIRCLFVVLLSYNYLYSLNYNEELSSLINKFLLEKNSSKKQDVALDLLEKISNPEEYLSIKEKNETAYLKTTIKALTTLSLYYFKDEQSQKDILVPTIALRKYISEIESKLFKDYDIPNLTEKQMEHMVCAYMIMTAAQIHHVYRLVPDWMKRINNNIKSLTIEKLAADVYVSSIQLTTGRHRFIHRAIRNLVTQENTEKFLKQIKFFEILSDVHTTLKDEINKGLWINKKEYDTRVLKAKEYSQIFKVKFPTGERKKDKAGIEKEIFDLTTGTYVTLGDLPLILTTGHIDHTNGFIEVNNKKLNLKFINITDILTHYLLRKYNVPIDFERMKRFVIEYLAADFSIAILDEDQILNFTNIEPFEIEEDPIQYANIYNERAMFVGYGEYISPFDNKSILAPDNKKRYYAGRLVYSKSDKPLNDIIQDNLKFKLSSVIRYRTNLPSRGDLAEDSTGFEGLCGHGCSGSSIFIHQNKTSDHDTPKEKVIAVLGQGSSKTVKDKIYNIHNPLLPYLEVFREIIQKYYSNPSTNWDKINLDSFKNLKKTYRFPYDALSAFIKQEIKNAIQQTPEREKKTLSTELEKIENDIPLKDQGENLLKLGRKIDQKYFISQIRKN